MSNSERETARAKQLEELLARCLELSAELGPGAIEQVCAEAPEDAKDLRAHLNRLSGVGMLPDELLPESMRSGTLPQIEPYQLETLLGSGGMGVVYRAIDTRNGATVALKTADPRVPWSERARERFRREVSAVGRVNHPHVVGVIDVGEASGLPYFTMPFVDGVTLAELLDGLRARTDPGEPPSLAALTAIFNDRIGGGLRAHEGAFSRGLIATLCRIAFEVAGGLHHLHEQGIVHRDVKPSNILVDADGHAHLFDLGLAHLIDDRRMTLTGDFAGSPQYAAPEQVSANRGGVDARTDVYGLGATLFEALALRPPLVGRDTPDLLRRILREQPPPLRHVAPNATRDLEILCGKCLEKSPSHRYASAAELSAELGRFLALEPIQARAPGLVRRAARNARRNPAKATAAGLAGAILLGAPIALGFHNRELGIQRDAANQSAANARREAASNREVSDFLQSLVLGLEQSDRPGDRAAARELLHVARVRLADDERMAPSTRAGLQETVARILAGMGRESEALPLLDLVFQGRQAELGAAHPDTRASLFALVDLHMRLGDLGSARGLADRALREANGQLDPNQWTALGNLTLAEGDVQGALRLLRRALQAQDQSSAPSTSDAIFRLRSLASAELAAGELTAALETVQEAVVLGEQRWAPDAKEHSGSLELLASIQDARGDASAAIRARERSLDLYHARGQAAAPVAERLLERLSATPVHLRPEDWLALAELRDGEPAREAFKKSLEALAGTADPDPSLVGRAHIGLARAALAAGDTDGARAELDACVPLLDLASGDLRFGDDWFELELTWLSTQLEQGHIQDLPESHLVRSQAWFQRRTDRVVDFDLALVGRLRNHARRLIELGEGLRALPLLTGARDIEERFASRSRDTFDHVLAQFAGSAYGEAMQRGITAIQAEQFDRALEAFRTSAELQPDDPVSHINQACALARSGRPEEALSALERAAERGYAHRRDAIELTENDPDLKSLVEEPRFTKLIADMRAELAEAEAAWKTLHFREPKGMQPTDPAPLLVVLHGDGEHPNDVLNGPWRDVAQAIGARLLAPSGRFPSRRKQPAGMRFVETPERYMTTPRTAEQSVRYAIRALRELRPVIPEQTVLVGRGLAGTLAFHLMATSPELARGALVLEGALPLELIDNVAPGFASQGLAVAVWGDLNQAIPRLPRRESIGSNWESVRKSLEGLGLRTRIEPLIDPDPGSSQLLESLRFLGAR